jgi:hypothetical protein
MPWADAPAKCLGDSFNANIIDANFRAYCVACNRSICFQALTMKHCTYLLRTVFISVIGLACLSAAMVLAAEPLENAHAHNDYWHERPLFDALDRGFASVEADLFLVNGLLLVGHDSAELNSDRTLESLYLKPLARRVRENSGRVYANGRRFFLFVDIKSDADQTWQQMQPLLSKYADMLTTSNRNKNRNGAVTVVLTGNRPIDALSKSENRYATLDGRLDDLDRDMPDSLMPVISDAWTAQFDWRGDGPMPDSQRAKLREIVRRAHQRKRVLRFWETPENEAVWQELQAAGVDLIGTDQLDRLAGFLRSKKAPADNRLER